jgi:hypothetical protein
VTLAIRRPRCERLKRLRGGGMKIRIWIRIWLRIRIVLTAGV